MAVTNKSGLAEFFTSSQNLAILTLRFNATNSFTAAPVYAQAGPPVIGTGAGSTAPPFSHLFVSGLWTLGSTAGFILFDVTPVGDGTYKAATISQQPLVLMSFQKGTLQGQTLSFNSVTMGGFYGTTPVTSGTLTLTVNNFYQPGSTVSGSLMVNTTSGGISGTSTYLP